MGLFDPEPKYDHYSNTRRLRELADAQEARRVAAIRAEDAAERAAHKAARRAEKAATAREVAAWKNGPNGMTFGRWKPVATKFRKTYLERERLLRDVFAADVSALVTAEERSQFTRTYVPKSRRQRWAEWAVLGYPVAFVTVPVAIVSWIVSWFGVHSGVMIPWLIGAAVFSAITIPLADILPDKAWRAETERLRDIGVARRADLFGFDPLSEPRRLPVWHSGPRFEVETWSHVMKTAPAELWDKSELPTIFEPKIIVPADGHNTPKTAELIASWKDTKLLA